MSEMDAFAMQFQEDRLCEDCSAVKNLEMILGDASQARTALTQLLPEEALDQPLPRIIGRHETESVSGTGHGGGSAVCSAG